MAIPTIIEDGRKIVSISAQSWAVTVGRNDVTRIVPYHENGSMAPVVWLAIYKGDNIISRVDSAGLYIEYDSEVEE